MSFQWRVKMRQAAKAVKPAGEQLKVSLQMLSSHHIYSLFMLVFKDKVNILILFWSCWHTCECLTEACEVEELTFGYGEQLNKEDQEGDGGEDHRQDHESLDGLQPVWERRARERG